MREEGDRVWAVRRAREPETEAVKRRKWCYRARIFRLDRHTHLPFLVWTVEKDAGPLRATMEEAQMDGEATGLPRDDSALAFGLVWSTPLVLSPAEEAAWRLGGPQYRMVWCRARKAGLVGNYLVGLARLVHETKHGATLRRDGKEVRDRATVMSSKLVFVRRLGCISGRQLRNLQCELTNVKVIEMPLMAGKEVYPA